MFHLHYLKQTFFKKKEKELVGLIPHNHHQVDRYEF